MESRPDLDPLLTRWYVWFLAAVAAFVVGAILRTTGLTQEQIWRDQLGLSGSEVERGVLALLGVTDDLVPTSRLTTVGTIVLWLALAFLVVAVVAPLIWRSRVQAAVALAEAVAREQERPPRVGRTFDAPPVKAPTARPHEEGWYADPGRPGMQRWFDGTTWTWKVRPEQQP